MFLKIFEPIFAALNKNTKLTLWAIVLAVLIIWGISGEYRLNKKDDDCADDRKSDRETINAQSAELKDVRTRLFDAFMEKRVQSKETSLNDSLIRKSTSRDINKVLP